jgi:DNA-binding response OmpR family regulator
MKQVLFADNSPEFLDTRAESLEKAGYKVLKARSPEEAQRLLSEGRVHLAIIDIRLTNDHDDRDISGLTLAKKEAFRHVPKIMLTAYPTYEAVRQALGHALDELPAAVEYVAKQEGAKALTKAIEKAFALHVRINWDLIFQPGEANSPTFLQMVNFIEGEMEADYAMSRAAELEDLFRSLFYEMIQIRIGHMLWTREGRVALAVYAFAEQSAPQSFVVVCGERAHIKQEASRYNQFAPKTPEGTSTLIHKTSATTHFGANAYILTGADVESLHPLAELYRASSDKTLHHALEDLFQKTLLTWQRVIPMPAEPRTYGQAYCERLGLSRERISEANFEKRLQSLARQAPQLGVRVRHSREALEFQLGEQSFSYPSPVRQLSRLYERDFAVPIAKTPGLLSGDNVLADQSGHTWLTDFVGAGLAPQLWDLEAIEAAIRFDWVEPTNIRWLFDFERCLVAGDFSRFDLSDIEPPLRRPAKTIQVLRRLALNIVGKDPTAYHWGILCHAAHRLVHFSPEFQLLPNELARLMHILLSISMIAERVRPGDLTHDAVEPRPTGIRLDEAAHAVWVNSGRIPLRGQSYDLLKYLYQRRNQLCTRREIIENVFEETYREKDESQIGKLNTAIRRLREKIEDDPNHPRYLLTEPGGGYRLTSGAE